MGWEEIFAIVVVAILIVLGIAYYPGAAILAGVSAIIGALLMLFLTNDGGMGWLGAAVGAVIGLGIYFI